MSNYRLNDNNILFISHIYSTRLICMTLIACFIFDIKKYQEKEHLTAAHRNEKYLSNSVCCDVARVCGGSCKIFLDFGSLVAKRNPSKTSSPGSRNEQALEANDDHQRRACPQLPCPQYSRALLSLNGAHEAPAAEPAVKMATRALLLARQPPPTS